MAPNEESRFRLVWDEQGEGRPVVVLPWGPGGFGTLYRWALQPLAQRFRLIHWDYRGCGGSSPSERYSLEDDVLDLVSILDALELERPVLLGHSYGGMVALYLATEMPERLGGLVLSNTLASARGLRQAHQRRKQSLGVREYQRWERLGLRAVSGAASGEEKLRYLEIEARHWVRDPKHLPAVLRRFRINFEVLATAQPSLQAFDVSRRLREVKAPTLVLSGHQDPIVGEEPKALHMAIRGSRFHRFMKSAHLPFLEEPAAFTRVVTEWLDELDGEPLEGSSATRAQTASV